MDGAEILEPKTLQEAIKRANWVMWKIGMAEEYKTLIDAVT